MLICETHFTTISHFSNPGYKTCFAYHPDGKAHGDTAILIKSAIAYTERISYVKPELQATIIEVHAPHRKIVVASTYCPPRFKLKPAQFTSFFKFLGACFVVGGDFNCKHTLWGSRLITNKGRELAAVIEKENYSVLSTGYPTYWPTYPQKTPDLLDFFVTFGFSSSYADIVSSYDLSSDHTPIIATISKSITTTKRPPRLHNSRTN